MGAGVDVLACKYMEFAMGACLSGCVKLVWNVKRTIPLRVCVHGLERPALLSALPGLARAARARQCKQTEQRDTARAETRAHVGACKTGSAVTFRALHSTKP